jgi:hypothetical protein
MSTENSFDKFKDLRENFEQPIRDSPDKQGIGELRRA